MTKRYLSAGALALALFLPAGTSAHEVRAIVHAKLLTVANGTIEDGTLIIRDGKIDALGGAGTKVPEGAIIYDATGMTVYPGLIDAINDDALVTGALHGPTRIHDFPPGTPAPHMQAGARAAPTPAILVNRLNGILAAGLSPGDLGPEPGQVSFVQYGDDAKRMVLIPDAALILNFGETAKRSEGFPITAFGVAGYFRRQLTALADYRAGVGLRDGEGRLVANPKFDALIPYLDGKRPIVAFARTDTEIGVALDIAEEFSLRIIIAGAANINREVDRVARLRVPVIFGNIWDLPLDGQRYDTVYAKPAELSARGVRLALATMGRSAGGARNLPDAAGAAVAYGLPYDMALRAITLTPAELYGVADRLGSLEVGKSANIVVASGDPLDVTSDVKQIFIAGAPVAMTSFQTDLRDRYQAK